MNELNNHNQNNGILAYKKLGWAFLIFLAAVLLLPSLIIGIVMAINPELIRHSFFTLPLNYICMYLIGFPLLLLVLRRLPSKKPSAFKAPQKKLSVLMLLALYAVSFAVVGVVSTITTLIESLIRSSGTIAMSDILDTGIPSWVLFLLGVVVAPVMEEIIFRGLPYNKAGGSGKKQYIIWTAIIFGLFHLNFGQSVYAAALGLLFALIVYETGSILYPIILHIMVNFTGGVGIGSIIIRSGSETAYTIYGWYTLALMVVGVIIGIVMLVKRRAARKNLATPESTITLRQAFFTPGTIIYTIICLAVIILMFFS